MTDYSNPLRGIVPKVVYKDDIDDTALVELVEKLQGEVAFDAYVKALMSTPEVAGADYPVRELPAEVGERGMGVGIDRQGFDLRAVTEDAAVVLKNRLEVADLASRIRKRVNVRLEPFQDDLRLTKPTGPKAPDSDS